jgi:hypothetical protein
MNVEFLIDEEDIDTFDVEELNNMEVYRDGDGDICMRVGDSIVVLEENAYEHRTFDVHPIADLDGEGRKVYAVFDATITLKTGERP